MAASTGTPEDEIPPGRPQVDAVVVGAGIGGIYAVHSLLEQGFTVAGVEAAGDVGGVWYHNRYPGARVDVESYFYCYTDKELYQEWQWTERYPAQPEILRYLNFAADRWEVRPHIRFNTWMVGAQWDGAAQQYKVSLDDGSEITSRFLIMTTGQLSKPRPPAFEGLEDFEGRWLQTARWPQEEVETAGLRVGVIGTGSTGIQVVPPLARTAGHLYVFQRTPNYSAPAHNGPLDQDRLAAYASDVQALEAELDAHPAGFLFPLPAGALSDYTPEERADLLAERWAHGGHTMNTVFREQGTSRAINDVVADYMRDKVRQTVTDPAVAERLVPDRYPLGSRRLALDIGYYETFNRENVTLVDIGENPIVRIDRTGIQTTAGHVDLDLIVFALGFEAFTGALDEAGIRNEEGLMPSDRWDRGPRTFLGLMTHGFPNLFVVTGPGSPSVLANLVLGNVQHVDLLTGLMVHMREHGYATAEPTEAAEDEWVRRCAEVAAPLIRLTVNNFMVHVNDDGSRVFIPWAGGWPAYVAACREVVASQYEGISFQA